MILLVCLLVTLRNLLFGIYLTEKIITIFILTKITISFRQVLLISTVLSVRFVEYFNI